MRLREPTPSRWAGARAQQGQTSTEYLGVLVVVAAVVAALVLTGPGIGEALGGGIRQAICRITAGDCDGGQSLTQGGAGSGGARGNDGGTRPSGDSDGEDGGGFLDGVGNVAGDVGGGVADGVGGGIRGGRAFLNGLIAGDANREGYDNPFLEGARGAGHLVSGILVLGDVRDIGVAGHRIITSGGGWGDLGLSVVGLVPFLGDGAKAIKGGKGVVDATQNAGDIARRTEQARDAARAPTPTRLGEDVLSSSRWSPTDFNGTRVYQRNDLIGPAVVDRLGRSNLQRMQDGLAPIGPDGNPINLHHMLQTPDGPIAELTQTFHQSNSRVIHINPNTIPSGINRSEFEAWRRTYWMWRAEDFG